MRKTLVLAAMAATVIALPSLASAQMYYLPYIIGTGAMVSGDVTGTIMAKPVAPARNSGPDRGVAQRHPAPDTQTPYIPFLPF